PGRNWGGPPESPETRRRPGATDRRGRTRDARCSHALADSATGGGGICRPGNEPPGVSGRDTHHFGLVLESDAESCLHPRLNCLRERQEIRARPPKIHQRERVARRHSRTTPAV